MEFKYGILFLVLSNAFTLTVLMIGLYVYNKTQETVKKNEKKEKNPVDDLFKGIK